MAEARLGEAEEATRLIEQGELQGAQRLLRRSVLALDYVIAQLEMLEALSPWEYQAIRKVLGHGSRASTRPASARSGG